MSKNTLTITQVSDTHINVHRSWVDCIPNGHDFLLTDGEWLENGDKRETPLQPMVNGSTVPMSVYEALFVAVYDWQDSAQNAGRDGDTLEVLVVMTINGVKNTLKIEYT